MLSYVMLSLDAYQVVRDIEDLRLEEVFHSLHCTLMVELVVVVAIILLNMCNFSKCYIFTHCSVSSSIVWTWCIVVTLGWWLWRALWRITVIALWRRSTMIKLLVLTSNLQFDNCQRSHTHSFVAEDILLVDHIPSVVVVVVRSFRRYAVAHPILLDQEKPSVIYML